MSEEELSAMLNEMSDRSDPLTASPFDKCMGLVFFSLSLINLVVCLFFSSQPLIGVGAIIFAILGGANARYPKVIWAVQKLRVRIFANADDITPNDVWSLSRKISYWILLGFTLFFTIMSLIV